MGEPIAFDDIRTALNDAARRLGWRRRNARGRVPSHFVQYQLRFDNCLHYEVVLATDGEHRKVGPDRKSNYKIGVAYVELHFERHGMISRRDELRMRFFAERIKNLKGKYRFIPEWGTNGLDFALRHKRQGSELEGYDCSGTESGDSVKSGIVADLAAFIKAMDPVLDRLTEEFNNQENGMKKVDDFVEQLERAKQIVFTGAPGTGKTYLARQVAQKMILGRVPDKVHPLEENEKSMLKEQLGFVQFHPSYDYTDFIEGLRPYTVEDSTTPGFRREDGSFKKLCKEAIAAEKCDGVDNFDEVWDKFIAFLFERHSKTNPLEIKANNCTFKVYRNGNRNLSFITSGSVDAQGSLTKTNVNKFYMDPTLKDPWKCYFIGVIEYLKGETFGLKPYVRGRSVAPGDRKKFVMIVDEINRGDIAKIFGELFFAMDKGYRGNKDLALDTQYQNLVDAGDPFADGFYVPDNVYIIGTMNDVDRNVESMDFAIRRRFTWIEIEPDPELLDTMLKGVDAGVIKTAKARMRNLNAAIEGQDGLGKAYWIGPAYFGELKSYCMDNDGGFKSLWENHLEPLIREYLRGVPRADVIVKKLGAVYDQQKKSESNETTPAE